MTASDDAGASSSSGSLRRRLNGVLTLTSKWRLTVISAVLLVMVSLSVWPVIRAPVELPASPLVVNDVSQLNPIQVSGIIVPTTTAEIADAVARHGGPISIGGARHSMGGQIATKGALHIDMRQFNRILEFSPASRTITAQAGATWRKIQEQIDPANLSVKIMQSYANFTVGGSLSVNGHGRYVGLGPLIRSIKSAKVVLADGSIVEASPTDHTEIFDGVIGGYGGLGVITEATMELTDDVRVRRETEVMPITTYLLQEYFVPVERFDEFVPQMRRVLQTHDVNVVNVSIRHSTQDPGSLLAWARVEVFAFVIYYKQPTDPHGLTEAGVWTRELIDAALSVGGSYYLPYQLHATEEQFRRAYPRAAEFFALKQHLDPTNKFRNKLLDKYYDPAATSVR